MCSVHTKRDAYLTESVREAARSPPSTGSGRVSAEPAAAEAGTVHQVAGTTRLTGRCIESNYLSLQISCEARRPSRGSFCF